jgi:hypothetical protein
MNVSALEEVHGLGRCSPEVLSASLTKHFLLLLLPPHRVTSAAVAAHVASCSNFASDRGQVSLGLFVNLLLFCSLPYVAPTWSRVDFTSVASGLGHDCLLGAVRSYLADG